MDARTGYTDRMTQREPGGGALVRAVAYVRVSSEEQRRHGYSLDDQERELRIQIGLKDWELVEKVYDEGGRREFWDNPDVEHIAVPIPDLGVPREHVDETRRRVLANLTDKALPIRDYETVPEERTEANPLGIYALTAERIRHLPEEEVEKRRRRAEDERAARYRAVIHVGPKGR